MRKLSPAEEQYNTEFLLYDQFFEFHRELFKELTTQEFADLLSYYPQDLTDIEDVFLYRERVLKEDTNLGTRARASLAKVLEPIGVHLPG